MTARDVFMPALGMAQETGVIVAWLKRPGEAVRIGDLLFEVETDKAVMAVEADAEGVLGDVRHDDGAEVPVGEVIARILPAGAAPAGPAGGAANGDAAAPAAPAPEVVTAPLPASAAQPPSPLSTALPAKAEPVAPARVGDRRVLASPKARRVAAERGVDLRALLAAGAVEPLHARDLDRVPAPASVANRIAARAGAGAFLAFRALLAEQNAAPSDILLWAAFAGGSLREALGADCPAPLVVAVERPGDPAATFADPDLGPLAEVAAEAASEARGAPALVLRDLTGRRLTEVALARDAGPALSIAGGSEGYALTLAWPGRALDEDQAIRLIEAMAARIEQPLRHLL